MMNLSSITAFFRRLTPGGFNGMREEHNKRLRRDAVMARELKRAPNGDISVNEGLPPPSRGGIM